MVETMRGDVLLKRGYDGFGCRLRRLSQRIDQDLRDVYQANGIHFDPGWFPLLAALQDYGPLSLHEIAASTGMTGASIVAARNRLIAEGLVLTDQDPRDLRRQRFDLSPKGRALMESLAGLWIEIGRASQALCAETAPDLLSELEVLEKALTRRGLTARVKARLKA
jgi:MarR family transcriptional regulator, organic hydroperoxide resistance regulator